MWRKMNNLRTRVPAWLTGMPWQRRAIIGAAFLLVILGIGFGLARGVGGRGHPQAHSAPLTATATAHPIPVAASPTAPISGGDPSSPSDYPTPATTPVPTPTLSAISGIGARLRLYPRA